MNRDELLEKLRALPVVTRGTFQLRGGATSDIYLDMKHALGFPALRRSLAELLWEQIPEKPTCIAVQGHGGICLGTELSSLYEIPLAMIRKEPKQYGKMTQFDGYVPSSQDRVIIVDDVLTSGSSVKEVINTLQPTGAPIIGIGVLVKRGEAVFDVPLHYLFTLEDFK